ncbi:Pentatricopeptide repeat [Dillenia turbinata]|uniref:Pentatricopeptide repeat n=1 Tax=Dillenia turbinata TaxID=194707 RepID=A0AAN8Z356_9MAGN
MPARHVVSWSTLIGGYVQCGMSKQALGVFREMQVANMEPNDVTLVSVLAASPLLGALEQGKWVHGYLNSNGVELVFFWVLRLIDMYTKCGEVELALEVFNGMSTRNLLVWTSMIKGLAMHGWGKEAFSLIYDLERAGIVPDDITFIGVLCACTHAEQAAKNLIQLEPDNRGKSREVKFCRIQKNIRLVWLKVAKAIERLLFEC